MISIEKKLLKGEYISVIRNRKIADMFKEVGLIEKYGTGIRRILAGFDNHVLPEPRFEEFNGGFRVTVYKQAGQVASAGFTNQVKGEVTAQVLNYCQEPRKASEIMELLSLKHWKTFQENYLNQLLEAGLIERTIPDKPRSSKQKYRRTEKGRKLLNKAGGDGKL